MEKRDVIIVGTGAAGLFCTLHMPADKEVLLITKEAVDLCDSSLAQGGICVLKDDDDYAVFFEDTMKAGHYKNKEASVDTMIRGSRDVIADLIGLGVEFHQENGKLVYTREAAHSTARILFHDDLTGKEIVEKLLAAVRKRPNVSISDYTTMIDLLESERQCAGLVVETRDGTVREITADYVVLATGGLGGLYEHSTNYAHLTGDGIAIAIRHGISVENLNYIQIHPTAFYSEKGGRRFLISESVRGEGAFLLNKNKERFTDELLPRDKLTEAIRRQMEKDGTDFVWLSLTHLPAEAIKKRFPNICRHCLSEGYDITTQCIPVTPAQHYLMGGIAVDRDSRTSMARLYAIGETSNNGVHGANRLASNSLLESLVFAKRAARHINYRYEPAVWPEIRTDRSLYCDSEARQRDYREVILREIERENLRDGKKTKEEENRNEQ